ncbi:hypothetical protein HXX76_010829 [Chlamydomonas incerta]|uniref:Uncharacterized protein n=1 Tax=Chlamydomonas incerta TaxID=51695 RepID=A0A835VYD5_CHLIN|nr:hypothetical protein HXX76_010829 [Chlamydomonas incerta]|eukprot:KAG2429596.1 hypothetical protein HXX76_010829 [Chlamydomonas incerta]
MASASDPEPAVAQAAPTQRVGFVGLGAMGKGQAACLARHLQASGAPPLLVFNRDASKTQQLLADPQLPAGSVEAAESLEAVARACDVVFTMLAHDGAVREVAQQLAAAFAAAGPAAAGSAGSGAGGSGAHTPRIVVDSSTVSPDTTREMAAVMERVGAQYVACPVLGRPDAAAAANLLIFCSGPEDAKQRIAPYLACMSRKVLDLGGEAHKANVMKLLANFHLVSLIELLAEGMTLAEKNGIPRQSYMSFIDEILPVPIVHGYGSRIAADAFGAGAGFTVTLGLKDVNLMRRLAESSEAPLPLADVAYQHLLAAKANGMADRDWAALAVAVRRNAGLTGPPPPPPAEGQAQGQGQEEQ